MKTTLQYSSAQDIGSRRLQEDSLFCGFIDSPDQQDDQQNPFLAIVADGMGGHIGGEVASGLAINGFLQHVSNVDPRVSADLLTDALVKANQGLHEFCQSNPKYQGMGTTLLATWISGDQLHYISVGDSLLYLLRNDEIRLLNTLHSYADVYSNDAINSGQSAINTQQSLSHVLTSCLNGADIANIDSSQQAIKLLPGDRLLLSTDGINTLGGIELRTLLNPGATTSIAEPEYTPANRLISTIKQKQLPGQDNTSVIVLSVT